LQINVKAWQCLPPPPPETPTSLDAGSDEDDQTLAVILNKKWKESPGPLLLKRKTIYSDSVK
jgi:hypothetical protein